MKMCDKKLDDKDIKNISDIILKGSIVPKFQESSPVKDFDSISSLNGKYSMYL